MQWFEKMAQSLWTTKPAVLDVTFLQSNVQSCLSGVICCSTAAQTTEMWTMSDYTAVHLPFYTTSSPQNLLLITLLFFLCPLHPMGRFTSNAPSAFFLILQAVLLLSVSFLLLHPVFLDLLPSFSSYYILFNPHNKPFLLYFLLLYLSPTLAFCSLAHASLCVSSMPTTVPG